MLDLREIKTHLNMNLTDTAQDDELTFFAASAEELIARHPDLRPEFLPLDLSDPLMRLAVLEVVRDMWSNSQRGSASRPFGQQDVAVPVPGMGRPTFPPYVLGLLAPFLNFAATPRGSFPKPQRWPDSTYPAGLWPAAGSYWAP